MPSKRIEQNARNSKKARAFEQKYISVPELATRWSVSRSAIYHGNCSSNALTPIRFGRAVRFLRTEVEAFEKHREAQTQNSKEWAV